MTGIVDVPQPREMTLSDLDTIAELHRNCFPDSISVFSALSNGIIKGFYTQILQEPENYVVVLEEVGTGRLVGIAFGTRKLGIQRRFLKRHFVQFIATFIARAFVSSAIWKYVWNNLLRKKGLHLRAYDSVLEQAGVPLPKGTEVFFMLVGVHPQWRGGRNAERIVKFFTTQIFKTGVTRIRGAIRPDNLASLILHKRLGWNIKKISAGEISVWIDRPSSSS